MLEKILEEMKKIKDGNRKENLYAKYPPKDEQGKILNGYSQGYEDGTDNFYNAVVDIIRKHMNVGWIPVKMKFPPQYKELWVTVERDGETFVATDSVTESGDFQYYDNILAWKEKESMPEPYRLEKGVEE